MISSDHDMLIAIGLAIRTRRKALNISQAELAYKIGMEVPNLSVIENGKSNPQILTLIKIAAALDSQLQDLLPQLSELKSYLDAPSDYKPRKHRK